jgi:hypothetical protein
MSSPKIPAETRQASRAGVSSGMKENSHEQKVDGTAVLKIQDRIHNTRGKKPKTLRKEGEDEENNQEMKAEREETATVSPAAKSKVSINGAATILASLDSRSHQRALIEDANALTENVLLPVSLPWGHKVPPVSRNIPCDIDECVDIITVDDGLFTPFENGSFGFGQFDTGLQRLTGESAVLLANSSSTFRAAARRSRDPGVIELRTIALPPSPFSPDSDTDLEAYCSARIKCNGSQSANGEVLLQCFEAMQARKKRKIVQARRSTRSYKVSVKVDSCSSRSSILGADFLPMPDDRQELLASGCLEALLPVEVEVGKWVSNSAAKKIANLIGSYNIPQGLEVANSSGKGSNKAVVGRTRLIWTKENGASYASPLTGDRIEPGAHQRPREVLLRIILNGQPFNGRKENQTVNSSYSTPFQATVDGDVLICNLLENKQAMNLSHCTLPQIECIPNNCGDIHVICVSPGKVPRSSVSSALNQHASKHEEGKLCTVCWHATEGGLSVMQCKSCGLLAHRSCCLDPGTISNTLEGGQQEWSCSVCSESEQKFKREVPGNSVEHVANASKTDQKPDPSPQCVLCHLPGGAMSLTKWGENSSWMHEVCRIWTFQTRARTACINKPRQCALCGIKEDVSNFPRSTVKCAVSGCHISVHPMCALMSSFRAKTENDSQKCQVSSSEHGDNDVKMQDHFLCAQYTLTFALVKGQTSAYGNDPGVPQSTTIPVMFCGIHNPQRDSSFYGLYPGGQHLSGTSEALIIPRCREPVVGG